MTIIILIGLLIVLLDQGSKVLIETFLYNGKVDIISNIFSLTYVQNKGAAWGILNEKSIIFIFLIPIVLLAIIYYLKKYSESKIEKIFGTMIIAGAIGNYLDRIFRGYVVDFFDFKIWPVFNVADIFVVVGCVLLCLYEIFGRNYTKE